MIFTRLSWRFLLAVLALLFSSVPIVVAGGAQRSNVPANLLQLTGKASLDAVRSDGTEDFSVKLDLANAGAQPATIERADVLFANQGGWSWFLGDTIAQGGSFFGVGPVIAGSSSQPLTLGYNWSSPVCFFVAQLQATAAGGKSQDLLVTFPIRRTGYVAPAPFTPQAPIYLGVQEPLEILPLSSGKHWLTLTAQVVNGTGRPQTLSRLHATLRRTGGAVVFDRDLPIAFTQETPDGEKSVSMVNSTTPVPRFIQGFAIPANFRTGTLRFAANTRIDGRDLTLARDIAVMSAATVTLRAPVNGRWAWDNGPGESHSTVHSFWPEHRYAYDLVMLKNGFSFSGDPNKNESFFDWNQPILAAAAGTVVEVVDDIPDNFGHTPNPANEDKINSRIVIRHTPTDFSIYVHVRQGSAMVKKGQNVKAGELLGRVGNAGQSTEPHLHFAYFRIDSSGRPRALPMSFSDLKTPGGAVVIGVPLGSLEYVSP